MAGQQDDAAPGALEPEAIAPGVREAMDAMLFGQLASLPDLVAVTLRRPVDGRWWDITIRRLYLTRPRADGRPRRVLVYAWRAAPTPADDAAEGASAKPPGSIFCPRRFGSAAAALADALAELEYRGAEGGDRRRGTDD